MENRSPVIWPHTLQPQKPIRVRGIKNFGVVTPDVLYRGGRPNKKEGIPYILDNKIRTVVDLERETVFRRDLYYDSKDRSANYIKIRITDEQPPTLTDAEDFLNIVCDSSRWPIFVHCHGGEGRTAVLCALVRYSLDGWDWGDIIDEVINFRKWKWLVEVGIRDVLARPQMRFLRNWVADHYPGYLVPRVR